MRDVADRVGLSIKSVSRVLNGDPGVSPERTEHVLAVVQELGFRRNDLARGLRRSEGTETIGLVVDHLSSRFFAGLIRGVTEVAGRHGALVLVATTSGPRSERDVVLSLSSRRVDGLIIAPTADDHSYLLAERSAGMPLVFVDRPATGLTADTVIADNVGGAVSATRHLQAAGHRRVAVIGSEPSMFTMRERLTGWRETVGDDAALDDLVVMHCSDHRDAAAATRALLASPEPPTAILSLNNPCTIGTVRALQALGAENRIAVVGFDDFETADLLRPAVTVIAQDLEQMGRQAARTMFDRIGGKGGPLRTTRIPTSLIARGSGELAPPG